MDKKEVRYVIAVLRKGTLGSALRNECLRRASKKVFVRRSKESGKPIYKTHWQCAKCFIWYRDIKDLEVDHIDEIGAFTGDWHRLIMRMYFCAQDNVQALCVACHQRKTSSNATLRYERKKSSSPARTRR